MRRVVVTGINGISDWCTYHWHQASPGKSQYNDQDSKVQRCTKRNRLRCVQFGGSAPSQDIQKSCSFLSSFNTSEFCCTSGYKSCLIIATKSSTKVLFITIAIKSPEMHSKFRLGSPSQSESPKIYLYLAFFHHHLVTKKVPCFYSPPSQSQYQKRI